MGYFVILTLPSTGPMGREHRGDAGFFFPLELQSETRGTCDHLQRTWVMPVSGFDEDSGPLEIPTLGCVFIHSHKSSTRVPKPLEETSSPKVQRET